MRSSIGDYFVVKTKTEEDFIKKRLVIPSTVMDFLVGQRITPLVRPWLTKTRSELKPAERGRSVIRLQEICWNGQVEVERKGVRDGMVGCVLDLLCWQTTHPSTYLCMKDARPGHQNSEVMSWWVFR